MNVSMPNKRDANSLDTALLFVNGIKSLCLQTREGVGGKLLEIGL